MPAKEKVLMGVSSVCETHYDACDLGRLGAVLDTVLALFEGRHPGYLACDTPYHNLRHSLQTVDPFLHIIDGWNRAGKSPKISFPFLELGVTAVLFHDTGYIKKTSDEDGTGGKYTFVHITRSVECARSLLPGLGFDGEEVRRIAAMILCTGVTETCPFFHCEEEKICSFALGTADLIGQLASPQYVESLPLLFEEFREAYEREGRDRLAKRGTLLFESAEDLLRSTPYFYRKVAAKKFERMGSLNRFLALHWPDGRDRYREAIERNIAIIEEMAVRT